MSQISNYLDDHSFQIMEWLVYLLGLALTSWDFILDFPAHHPNITGLLIAVLLWIALCFIISRAWRSWRNQEVLVGHLVFDDWMLPIRIRRGDNRFRVEGKIVDGDLDLVAFEGGRPVYKKR